MSNLFNRLSVFLKHLTDVPVADPDDARRRRFLNIILLITSGVVLITAFVISVLLINRTWAIGRCRTMVDNHCVGDYVSWFFCHLCHQPFFLGKVCQHTFSYFIDGNTDTC
jgi:hypothetical protein